MYLSLIKKCRQQEKTYLIVLWKNMLLYFNPCDVDMKLLVENKVSHYPASDVLLKKARFLYRNQEIGMDRGIGCFSGKTWRLPGLGWKGCR